jgi:hypothetical protein
MCAISSEGEMPNSRKKKREINRRRGKRVQGHVAVMNTGGIKPGTKYTYCISGRG